MRRALNENPVVQVAILGLLVIAVGFLLVTRVLSQGGSGAEPETSSTSTEATSAGTAPAPAATADAAAGAVPPESPTAAAAQAAGAVPPEASSVGVASAPPVGEFTAGPGLPKDVVRAYDDGRAVALLITRKAGIEDRQLRAMLGRIAAVGDVAVFHAYARDIARYSRVTGGVDVNRVPALVVIRPKKLNDGGPPQASVAYGFRGPESVDQAVRDSLYQGRDDIPYYPE